MRYLLAFSLVLSFLVIPAARAQGCAPPNQCFTLAVGQQDVTQMPTPIWPSNLIFLQLLKTTPNSVQILTFDEKAKKLIALTIPSANAKAEGQQLRSVPAGSRMVDTTKAVAGVAAIRTFSFQAAHPASVYGKTASFHVAVK